jgi:hypothetical protein
VGEREVGGWVWPSNVERLLFWASHYVDYKFDDLDWRAVETALPTTDDDCEDGWYEYPLVGEPPLCVRLAQAVERPGHGPGDRRDGRAIGVAHRNSVRRLL